MTVTYTDASGGTLPSAAAARGFTCTAPLAYACVRYLASAAHPGQRPEEVIYRDGAFRYPYLRSTVASNVYSLVRDGGWPRDIELHAEEQTPIPTSGQPMGAIYEVDLTAQASQTMTAAGSYTIDGKVWWAKGALTSGGTSQTCAVVNGTGLQMTRPDPISSVTDWVAGGSYANRAMCFDVSQLANYNPNAPLAIEWRFVSTFASNVDESGGRYVYGSLLSVAASSAAISAGEHSVGVCLRRVNANSSWWRNPLNTTAVGLTMPSQSLVVGAVVQGIYRVSPSRYLPICGAWNGSALQTPNEMELFSDANLTAFAAASLTASPSFVFTADKISQNGTTMDFALTHLRVLQPKAA